MAPQPDTIPEEDEMASAVDIHGRVSRACKYNSRGTETPSKYKFEKKENLRVDEASNI